MHVTRFGSVWSSGCEAFFVRHGHKRNANLIGSLGRGTSSSSLRSPPNLSTNGLCANPFATSPLSPSLGLNHRYIFVLRAAVQLAANELRTSPSTGRTACVCVRACLLTLVAHVKAQVSVLHSTSLYLVMLLCGKSGLHVSHRKSYHTRASA